MNYFNATMPSGADLTNHQNFFQQQQQLQLLAAHLNTSSNRYYSELATQMPQTNQQILNAVSKLLPKLSSNMNSNPMGAYHGSATTSNQNLLNKSQLTHLQAAKILYANENNCQVKYNNNNSNSSCNSSSSSSPTNVFQTLMAANLLRSNIQNSPAMSNSNCINYVPFTLNNVNMAVNLTSADYMSVLGNGPPASSESDEHLIKGFFEDFFLFLNLIIFF